MCRPRSGPDEAQRRSGPPRDAGRLHSIQTLSEQIDPRTLEPHYALLPVWMLHTRWKEQDFLFAMNGQTGKLIGDLPVDKGRVAAWFAGISIPLMILTALIMLL